MRTTTILSPRSKTRNLAHRSTPFSNAMRGIGMGAALLVLGLIYLVLAPIGWCVRKFSGWHASH